MERLKFHSIGLSGLHSYQSDTKSTVSWILINGNSLLNSQRLRDISISSKLLMQTLSQLEMIFSMAVQEKMLMAGNGSGIKLSRENRFTLLSKLNIKRQWVNT